MVSKNVCAVSNCNTYGKTPPSMISLHKFPKDLNSCQKWIELAQNKKISKLLKTCGLLDLPKSFSICSVHFTKDDYMTNTGRSLLRYGSVPSINLPSTVLLKSLSLKIKETTLKKTPTNELAGIEN